MQLDVDLSGRRVLVVGPGAALGPVLDRYLEGGARLRVVVTDPDQVADRLPLPEAHCGLRYLPVPTSTDGWVDLLAPVWACSLVDANGEPGVEEAREQATRLQIPVISEKFR